MKERVVKWVDRIIRSPVIGLDISDRSIKYVGLKQGQTVAIELFGEMEVPEGIIVAGELVREEQFVTLLRELTARAGRAFHSSVMVGGWPEEKSFLRLLRLPQAAPSAVEEAIRWGLEDQIPLPPEDAYFDYELTNPLPGHSGHADAVITAFPKEIVDAYVNALKEAGLKPVALELECQAIVRSVVKDPRSADGKIVIDMGRNRTSFTIFTGGALLFTTTVAVGGRLIETTIAKAIGAGPEEAMRVKKEIGLAPNAYDGKLYSALLPHMETLSVELGKAVNYYEDQIPRVHGGLARINAILLSGGDSNLYGLDTYLASAIHIPVKQADPFVTFRDRMSYLIPPIPKNEALAFTAAIGLALRGQDTTQ